MIDPLRVEDFSKVVQWAAAALHEAGRHADDIDCLLTSWQSLANEILDNASAAPDETGACAWVLSANGGRVTVLHRKDDGGWMLIRCFDGCHVVKFELGDEEVEELLEVLG